MLGYLARVAQDIARDIERPVMVDCAAASQRWAMNLRAEWDIGGEEEVEEEEEQVPK